MIYESNEPKPLTTYALLLKEDRVAREIAMKWLAIVKKRDARKKPYKVIGDPLNTVFYCSNKKRAAQTIARYIKSRYPHIELV